MWVKLTAIFTLMATGVTLGPVLPAVELPLSPGDRVRILTPLDDDLPDESRFRISGLYEVNLDGTIQVPFLEAQRAAGLEPEDIERSLSQQLISKGIFRPETLQLSVRVAQWAPVQVTVAGETFFPGRVLINALPESDNNSTPRPRSAPEAVTGENPPERYLSAAIRSAGGLKPTADIRNIRLVRGSEERTLDMSGIVTGQPVPDLPLIAGDQVIVPKMAINQSELVRPSQLTPQTVTVQASNLTEPSNRVEERLQLEYGARFSQAAVAAGCAGGSRSTNAKRRVALVQTNRLTGESKVLDRPVEVLLKNSSSDTENPFLMPLDSVVCYDSTVTNVSGVLRIISNVFSPFFLIRDLFRND